MNLDKYQKEFRQNRTEIRQKLNRIQTELRQIQTQFGQKLDTNWRKITGTKSDIIQS